MCDICDAKVEKISSLAAYFRAKAAETSILHYVIMMSNAAADLDELSIDIREQCRHANAHGGHARPPKRYRAEEAARL